MSLATDLTTFIGQHAVLNSGGPRMRIEGVTPDQQFVCAWTDESGERQTADFPPEAVTVEPRSRNQDDAIEQAFIDATLPEEDRRAPAVVSDALVTHTLAVLGRRGAVAEREVRDVLEAAFVAQPLVEGGKPDLRFAHERVVTPDGTPEYFTQAGEKIDPANIVHPTGAAPIVEAPPVVVES